MNNSYAPPYPGQPQQSSNQQPSNGFSFGGKYLAPIQTAFQSYLNQGTRAPNFSPNATVPGGGQPPQTGPTSIQTPPQAYGYPPNSHVNPTQAQVVYQPPASAKQPSLCCCTIM